VPIYVNKKYLFVLADVYFSHLPSLVFNKTILPLPPLLNLPRLRQDGHPSIRLIINRTVQEFEALFSTSTIYLTYVFMTDSTLLEGSNIPVLRRNMTHVVSQPWDISSHDS
jgi:hypothetical protein